ncbi:hypothetical protein [Nonomuraea polychroma]|uniref:hypothetical protein n=1 Tax=Nonomuraea polychroma TaxID=46176 RepID=UPI0019D45693|nr:hypothetical protein [Nonomuraea polychroma]
MTVNDVLDGHVRLDIECLDRIYLNAYVPILQTSSQVVAFLSGHLGFPFPSPVLFKQLGDRFRRAVASGASGQGPRRQPAHTGGRTCRPGLRPCESSL